MRPESNFYSGSSPSAPAESCDSSRSSDCAGTPVTPTVFTTAEKVRLAATAGPEVNRALRLLFPDAFVDERVVDISDTVRPGTVIIQGRISGRYGSKGLWLSKGYDWSVERDEQGQNVLVARTQR